MNAENPLISVIIPTYNSAGFLDDCLNSIKNQSYANIELIVIDNNSKDNTKGIAGKYTEKVFNREPERSAQRNFGVKMCAGDFVLIIDSDMHLSPNVVSACVEKVSQNDDIKGLIIPEESFGEGFWSQCKKLERSFYVGVPWMEAARFFRRQTFEEMAGYNENNTGTEDFDLPQRISSKYGNSSIRAVKEYIYHNELRLSLLKTCKKKYYYAKKLDAYKEEKSNSNNFKKQSSIFSRYKLFFSEPKKII
ncbi:glycosyltransferase [Patescibacteria group bacterium]|nr:glycosyltransferase [Patescibacteria group bacterium]